MPRFHSILLLLFLLSAVHPAFCQWDRHFPIAQDTFAHGFPQILVDDSLRLHVFDVRQHNQPDGVRSSLYYQQFDHWGNPLTTPMNVFQDDHWQDYGAGVLLDRNNQIHVVWCRFYHIIPPTGNRVYYTSLSLEGQVLTDPFVMVTPYRNYAVQAGINLVQSEDGRIWVALDHFFAVLDEAGNVLQPFQPVYDPFYAINQPILASAPNNQVWAAVRFIDSTQNVSVVRVDTSVLVMEEVSGAYPDWLQMTPEAFFIDSTGAFHYVLYREDAGLVYQRDGRDGSPPDTQVINDFPYGAGSTFFTLAGGDTLVYIQGQTLPLFGRNRYGFLLSGERAYGPTFVPDPPPSFGLGDKYHFRWKRGGYWVIGTESVGSLSQLSLIHVPGPDEPPNATDDRTPQATISAFTFSPNPTTGSLFIHGPLELVKEVAIFNILGQRVSLVEPHPGAAPFVLPSLSSLPTGPYFVHLRTSRQTFVHKIILER